MANHLSLSYFRLRRPHYSYVPTEKEQESWRQEQSECLKKEVEAIKAAHPVSLSH
jgi:hypothetical protein